MKVDPFNDKWFEENTQYIFYWTGQQLGYLENLTCCEWTMLGIITSFSPEQREDVRWWFLNPAYSVTHCAYLSPEALRCNQSGNPLADVIFGAYEDTSMHVCIQLPLSHSHRWPDKSCMLGDSASANHNLHLPRLLLGTLQGLSWNTRSRNFFRYSTRNSFPISRNTC